MSQGIAQCLAMWTPGTMELIIVGIIALLLFGRRLPGAARSLGASFIQFKKGLSDDIQTEEEVVGKDGKVTLDFEEGEDEPVE